MSDTYQSKYDLIVEACKIEPDLNRIQTLIPLINDWSKLIEIAYMHGVLPLVYKILKSFSDVIPSNTLATFKAYNLQIARTNMQMTSELIRVVRILDDHEIKYMALKGPVLSQLIHGDTIQRQYTDLDILVEKEDIYRVGELLYAHGYSSEYDLKFLKNTALLKIGKDFTFCHNESNIFIEAHWKLFLDRQIKDSQINLFSPNPMTCKIQNYQLTTLEFDHLLIYLCLHGSKHFWERLEWVVDIDRLIKLESEINWDKITQIAKNMKIEVMFYLGLAVTQTIFQTELPESIQNKISNNPNIKRLHDNILELKFAHDITQDSEQVDKFKVKHLLSLMADTKSINTRNYLLWLFQIKKDDIYSVNLPNSLSILYYPIRLYRVIEYRVQSIKTRKSLGLKYIYLYLKVGIRGK